MHRSYLKIKPNDINILINSKALKADAIIINIYDFSALLNNYPFVLDNLKQADIKIYLEVDLDHIKNSDKEISQLLSDKITGFYISNPTLSQLRRFSLKCRAYEVKHHLVYKSLEFIVAFDKTKSYEKLEKIIKSNRINYLVPDMIVGLDNDKNQEMIAKLASTYHKILIERAQITSNLEAIDEINQKYGIDKDAVNQSLTIINNFNYGTKSERKSMLKKANLIYHYQRLIMAKRLGLIDDYPQLNFLVLKKKIKLLKKPIKIKKFYTLGEEIGNAVSHGVGIALAILAIIFLMLKGGSTLEIISYLVFGICALTLYTMSTLYHAFALGKKTKMLFQKFDHMTIYLLIAGTYTPFSLLAIGGKTGLYLCLFLWGGSLIGLLLNLFAFGRFRFLHMFLYVALGWVAIFFLPEITANLAKDGVWLLIIGGVMYTIGIFFYALRLFKFTHMIWHLFTVLGTIAHFLAILFYL